MNATGPRFAAAYIRVSTDEQVEYSPDSQLREMQDYAARNNMLILPEHIYVDEGISGKKSDNRPAFQRMIATAKNKPVPFDTLLLYKFSRFARNRDDSVLYKSLLRKKCGVQVISIKEPLDPDNKMSIIMEAFIEAMDEYYSLDLSENVKRTMTEKHLRGELQATPSFGYSVADNVLIPVPEEATLIREIFNKFVGGEGYYAIARWLNNMGVRTHRGGRFENRTIEYIIRNPVYIGKLRWNPTGRTRRDYDNENIILTDAKHEPLIDAETWDAAQKRMREIKTQWKYHGRPIECKRNWLSGLAKCSSCGGTMVFSHKNYWLCNNYSKGACSTSQHIREDLLMKAILSRLEEDAKTDREIKYKLVRLNDNNRDEAALLDAQIDRLNKKISRLREAFLSGAEDVNEYKAMKQSLENEVKDLSRQKEESEKQIDQSETLNLMHNAIAEALKVITSSEATKEAKHDAAHNIIERCIWDKSKNLIQIYYRLFF